MRVLFTASEIYPFVKTGGLGDVAAALPVALAKLDLDIRLLLPGYPEIIDHLSDIKVLKQLKPFFGRNDTRLLCGFLPNGLRTYVLDCPSFFNRSGPYGSDQGVDWPDNHLRFAALSRVAADLYLYEPDWQPDIVHGNDWQCGLMPSYLNLRGQDRPATVMTIHNMAYQGLFPPSVLPEINVPPEMFSMRGLEFYGKVGFLKAGLHYADRITTVSPTYAREIQTEEHGCGLDGLLRERSARVSGILNGIDEDVWNPKTDKNIIRTYGKTSLKHKTENRDSLLNELGLNVRKECPVFGVISRLVSQKGLDLMVEAAPEVLKMGAAFVVLGAGDKTLEKQFRDLAALWPAQVSLSTGYDEVLAHKIIAGADAVVIPSRFEPCGLVQIYALRYGTLPVVRQTGGLADTVSEDGLNSTGFVFQNPDPAALSETLIRVCALFRSASHWKKRQTNAMAQNFSWEFSAQKYLQLYQELI